MRRARPAGSRHRRTRGSIFDPRSGSAARSHQTLEQRWFAGSHSNVGGGYVKDGLANIPFRWLTDEAEVLGLAIDHDYLKQFKPYPQAQLYPSSSFWYSLLELVRLRIGGGGRSLDGHPPSSALSLDRSVVHRLRADPAGHPQLEPYRPDNVIRFLASQEDLPGFLAELGLKPDECQLPDDLMESIAASR